MAEERTFVFANFSRSTLAARISASATQIRLAEGEGERFPNPDGTYDEICALVVTNGGQYEVMYCTARVGDILTVERGKEGSEAKAFPAGAHLVHAPTAGVWEQIAFVPPPPPTDLVFVAGSDFGFTGLSTAGGGIGTLLSISDELNAIIGATSYMYLWTSGNLAFGLSSSGLLSTLASAYSSFTILETGQTFMIPGSPGSGPEWVFAGATQFEEGNTYSVVFNE